jgi:hypothetical protein
MTHVMGEIFSQSGHLVYGEYSCAHTALFKICSSHCRIFNIAKLKTGVDLFTIKTDKRLRFIYVH